jgi:hypothetical protein
MFTSLLMPTANKDQTDAFNELQRLSASPECAARYLETVGDLTVLELLSQVKALTIVMHVPSTLGRELAAGIPGARFVALPGKNHIPLEQDPQRAPVVRGTQRLLEERILAARALAGAALIGGTDFFTWCRLGKASTGAHRRVEGRIGQQAKAADFAERGSVRRSG